LLSEKIGSEPLRVAFLWEQDAGQLGNISGKEAVKAFGHAGWFVRGQVGSHIMMNKPGIHANLSIPQHKELSVGTLRKLIRAAALTVDEFLNLLWSCISTSR
jgi:predicted RNA binding protein YcfA (HicA-like mRNA interferase family)